MPHVFCLREPSLIELHFFSDGLIALSYGLIPLAFFLLMRRRRDLVFRSMFIFFGLFIVGCGLTHVLSMVTLWYPVYRLDGLVKAITAIASFVTAILLFRLLPQIEQLPNPSQLRQEVQRREASEADLRLANERLEESVRERTVQLSESEARFRTLMEAVPNLLWIADSEGRRTYVNHHYEHFTGLKAEDALELKWIETVHPDDKHRLLTNWKRARAHDETFECEYRIRRFDGVYCWFMTRAVAMLGEDGRVAKWLGSSTNVQDLRTVVEDLKTVVEDVKRTEAALRRSNEDLRQFAYVAAHDLQEPLRNIAGSVTVINRHYVSNASSDARKWAEAAFEGAERMHTMVKDLLQYSRVTDAPDGAEEYRGEPVSLNSAVNIAISNLSESIAVAQAAIEVHDLPSLEVLEVHMVQLFQNLISNAVKYRKIEERPRISISAERGASDWKFQVADNGIGFSPEYSKKIFGVFKRLHTRTQYPGNGIGLAICARIVAHYGGRIWADSRPGEGATFFFTLPA